MKTKIWADFQICISAPLIKNKFTTDYELPEDGLKSSPETSRFTENKWISRKNQNKVLVAS